MSASYTRQHKRRLARSSEAVDRVIEADARYFERFPHRSHRVRFTAAAELEANAAALGVDRIETDPGRRWFTAVRQIAPGVRTRLFVQNATDADADMTEAEACGVFDWLARNGSSKALEIEQKLRAAIEKRGRR